MVDFWRRCEGRTIEQKYPLRQYLGETPRSGVFLTVPGGTPGRKAVIKFIPAHPGTAKLHLSRWARAARLTHPNFLQLLDSGRCGLEGRDLLYVVVEYADENLSQILPMRALTPDEARDMLSPIAGALSYLHGQGLAHGRLKPTNVHAIGDQIKLSIDSVVGLGELRLMDRDADLYDAPELVSSPVTAASDVWSLGITLVEALTRQVPELPFGRQGDPEVPSTVPQPFMDIARHALKRDPTQRWTAADIAAHLKGGHVPEPAAVRAPAAIAAAAGASVQATAASPAGKATAAKLSPLDVPLSPERPIPVAKLPPVPPRVMPAKQKPTAPAKKTLVLPNYVVPLLAALLVIVAIFTLPRFLRHQQGTSVPVASSSPPHSETRITEPTKTPTSASPQPARKDSASTAIEKTPPPSAAPTKLRTEGVPPVKAAKLNGNSAARGEVMEQVLPQAPDKALNTIHGVVRVVVHVNVDAAGNVSQAELEMPGPSHYFADLALKAAGKWVFGTPEVEGKSVPSEWRIRFEYTQSGVVAYPQQTAP